jgi:inner membrane protein
MDNVTHSLVGLMLSRASGYTAPRTTAIMVIAANLPDIDVVTGLPGSLNYLQYHRSYTHSLAFAPLMALIPPLLFAFKQRISLRIYILSLIAVLSHLMLDWTNVYGIHLLLPFSSRWLRLDITDIVDPWILLILLLAVAAPALSRMVTAEISSRSGLGPRRAWAWFALLALFVYEGGRYTLHDRAIAVMGAHLFNGAVPRRISALPGRFNPLEWRGIVEGNGFVDIVPVNLADSFDPAAGRIDYPAPLDDPAIVAARATRPFQIFGQFAQLPFWKLTPLPDATRVELIDLRFGTPQFPGFQASALVQPSGQVSEAKFGFGGLPITPR